MWLYRTLVGVRSPSAFAERKATLIVVEGLGGSAGRKLDRLPAWLDGSQLLPVAVVILGPF